MVDFAKLAAQSEKKDVKQESSEETATIEAKEEVKELTNEASDSSEVIDNELQNGTDDKDASESKADRNEIPSSREERGECPNREHESESETEIMVEGVFKSESNGKANLIHDIIHKAVEEAYSNDDDSQAEEEEYGRMSEKVEAVLKRKEEREEKFKNISEKLGAELREAMNVLGRAGDIQASGEEEDEEEEEIEELEEGGEEEVEEENGSEDSSHSLRATRRYEYNPTYQGYTGFRPYEPSDESVPAQLSTPSSEQIQTKTNSALPHCSVSLQDIGFLVGRYVQKAESGSPVSFVRWDGVQYEDRSGDLLQFKHVSHDDIDSFGENDVTKENNTVCGEKVSTKNELNTASTTESDCEIVNITLICFYGPNKSWTWVSKSRFASYDDEMTIIRSFSTSEYGMNSKNIRVVARSRQVFPPSGKFSIELHFEQRQLPFSVGVAAADGLIYDQPLNSPGQTCWIMSTAGYCFSPDKMFVNCPSPPENLILYVDMDEGLIFMRSAVLKNCIVFPARFDNSRPICIVIEIPLNSSCTMTNIRAYSS